ncbi:hypothetical protein C9890_0485 [Perkinsus sp. BL_2016]|nr:hypothetical protein C9890_0485 [Perkinsus sp. BL_2016]
MNPRFRKTVSRAMIRKKGTTAIARLAQKKKHFHNPSTIRDQKFREVFDKEKSWLDNMNSVDLKEMYGDCLPEVIPDKACWTLPKLNEDELNVVRKLIATHGESGFKRMAFDRKLNRYQWTEDQCEKKVKLLLVDNRIHVCEHGKCLCGDTANSSYVSKKGRIRK